MVGIKAQEDTNEEDDELHAILLQAESSDALYVLTYLRTYTSRREERGEERSREEGVLHTQGGCWPS